MAEEKAGPLGLTKEEFEAWATHPTTRKVRRYLGDVEGEIRAAWSRGDQWTEATRQCVSDLVEYQKLKFEDIEAFYEQGDEDEEQIGD